MALLLSLAALPDSSLGRVRGSVVDDPNGVLGSNRLEVKRVAKAAGFRVSIVPRRRGRSYRKVISNRFSILAPRGSPGDLLLLLVLKERIAIFGVRNPLELRKRQGRRKAKQLLRQRRRASLSATRAFGRIGAAAAVLAGARGLRGLRQRPGRSSPQIEVGWGWLHWLVPLLLLIALINLVRAFRARRRLQAFSGGALAIRDLTTGTAMISGTVEAAEQLASPITRSPCVYFEYSVAEDWVTSDSEGTAKLASGNARVPFELRDATGTVRVVPDRAEIDPPKPVEDTVDRSSPYYEVQGIGGLPFPHSGDSAGLRHLRESIIALGSEVTVLGPVTVGESGARIEWNRHLGPSPGRPFLITDQQPGWAEHFQKKRMKRFFVISAVSLIAALVVGVFIT